MLWSLCAHLRSTHFMYCPTHRVLGGLYMKPYRQSCGTAVGTFAYAAPEMLFGLDSGVKVRQYDHMPAPEQLRIKYSV